MLILKKLIGKILEDLGFIKDDQLAKALKTQREIYSQRTLPERLQRASIVSESRLHGGSERTPLLGEILTSMGLVTCAQIEDALKQQDKTIEGYEALDAGKLGIVIEIGSLINSTLNLSEVLTLIMSHANRVTDSVASTLMLLDNRTGELVFSVPTGPRADQLTDIRIPPGKGIAGWVAEHEQPVCVANAREDPRFYSEIDKVSGLETESILCVPMKAKAKPIGVLESINKTNCNPFTREDVLFLNIFASQAAIAIENARLYGELKDQLEQAIQMQDTLAKSEKFEALGQMASGVAHDFNNILMAIIGYSEMVRYDIPEKGKARQNIDQVLKASNRAKDLVNQILAFSRPSEQQKKPVQIHLIIKEALKLLRASLPSTIEIKQDIVTESDTVLADPTQIHQIMMNLCTNAQHAMNQRGGILEVTLSPVELDDNAAEGYRHLRPGAYLKLSVSDTGVGMDPSTLERIFEPYFTTKEKGVGTGMGLAVVLGIVKSHGGAITVESEPGKGTAFHTFLPRIEEEVASEVEGLTPIPPGTERILFVDDEKSIVDLAMQMLRRLGYLVFTKTSSIEALEAFRAQPHKFDLVITDKTMPNMTGFELAEELKRIRPDIPIILLTGFSDSGEMSVAGAKGVNKLVLKPLLMSELAVTVREVLDKNVGVSAAAET